MNPSAPDVSAALRGLWAGCGLPESALGFARLVGREPALPSSFAVGTAAQASIAAAALAACELGHVRGTDRQVVGVDMQHAALECSGWFAVNGSTPPVWDPFSGLYPASDGWVRVHANFRHHREGALRLLGLDPAHASREDAAQAMARWRAVDFESAASGQGLVATALRSFSQWDVTPQAAAVAAEPLVAIERIGDAPPRALPPLGATQRPLEGLRVLDFTRILAGPVGTRALAAYGADVMLVNAPHLPNIDSIADTSRGKRSVHLDLRQPADAQRLRQLLETAHVMVQGYRPGGLAALGFGADAAVALRPGLVYVSLSAYGAQGPWAARRGFDSLVQTAMGFNHAEGEAVGDSQPRALPVQILDQASGYLIALGAAAALRRQQLEGGSWHVRVSLARTGLWLRSLGRVAGGFSAPKPDPARWGQTESSGFGELTAIGHSAQLWRTPAAWTRPSVPPGTDAARWDAPHSP